jgi:phosphinothricin acetyltransferase
MSPADASAVLAIYQAGLDGGQASFETAAPTWAEFDAGRLPGHRFVAVDPVAVDPVAVDPVAVDPVAVDPVPAGPEAVAPRSGPVLGWVAVSPVSARQVYAGVVEHSVYVDPAAHGRGVGRLLLQALIAATEAAGIWTIQSGVFPENAASLALHATCGFRVVGTRERVGRHHGRWRDVVLVERRSPTVG